MKATHSPSRRGIVSFAAALFTVLAAWAAFAHPADCAVRSAAKPALLPTGYLSARGSQIVDPRGRPVRIACVGAFGTVIVGGGLEYSSHYNGPLKGLDANLAAVRALGFNCLRADFTDKSVSDPILMSQFGQLVAGCTKYGLKVIFDNHNNEATPASWANAAQQSNGLWFDTGPGTDGTDGARDKGTISSEQFLRDWVAMAKHWAGNSTVVGFDIRNEPVAHTSTPALWGGNGPTDIHVMYQRDAGQLHEWQRPWWASVHLKTAADQRRLVVLGLPAGRAAGWLSQPGRHDAPRTSALYPADAAPVWKPLIRSRRLLHWSRWHGRGHLSCSKFSLACHCLTGGPEPPVSGCTKYAQRLVAPLSNLL